MIEVSERTRSGQWIADFLRDHAAHRRADDMGARDAERVHQPDRVGGHVLEQIGRGNAVALLALGDRRAGFGGRPPVDQRRLADVAIVVAHHPQAAFGERGAELVFPQDHLGAEAGDQQQRRIARSAEGLAADLQVADLGEPFAGVQRDIRHSALPFGRARS